MTNESLVGADTATVLIPLPVEQAKMLEDFLLTYGEDDNDPILLAIQQAIRKFEASPEKD